MKIEFDWQITEGEGNEPEWIVPPLSTVRARRRVPRWLIALALASVLGITLAAGYVAWTDRAHLNRATREVSVVARSEARAVAVADRPSFMALQDPDDAAWRTFQERRFGQLESVGIPEYGLQASGAKPRPGAVTLEPGGARLDVMYQFTVTLPMPGGPTSVALWVPQFYRQTPSGWVRALPGEDFWGSRRSISGKRVIAFYPRRDAGVVEPLIPHMDAVLERVCANLSCPAPVTVSFEIAPNRAGGWGVASFGRGPGGWTLNLLSPTLTGEPADGAARDELYRGIETRLIQELVGSTRASRRLRSNSAAYRQLVRWHLAQAGLSGPFITPEITNTLAASVLSGTWRPLSRVVLELSSGEASVSPNEAMVALAFQFITERFGADALAGLMPALATSPTVGEAINTALRVNPATLEPEWEAYLRAQAGLTPVVAHMELSVN